MTLAQLYDPDGMPSDLRAAHDANVATVEAAYGVSFNGDEERMLRASLFHSLSLAVASLVPVPAAVTRLPVEASAARSSNPPALGNDARH